jgi:hypothetical protein
MAEPSTSTPALARLLLLLLAVTSAPAVQADTQGEGCLELSASVGSLLTLSVSTCLHVTASDGDNLVISTSAVAGDLIVDVGDSATAQASADGSTAVSISFPNLQTVGGQVRVIGERADSVISFAQLTAAGSFYITARGTVIVGGIAALAGDVTIAGEIGRVDFPSLAAVTGNIIAHGSTATGIFFDRLSTVSGKVVVNAGADGMLLLQLGTADNGRWGTAYVSS